MVEDDTLSNVKARMIEWIDDEEKDEALFEFEDGSDSTLGIFDKIGQKHIVWMHGCKQLCLLSKMQRKEKSIKQPSDGKGFFLFIQLFAYRHPFQ